ncbi:hypothetical protein E2C01_016177 [Portunus trituberculatus]|uniref:Uncharacterized protein n=1 Tax=Portunus trituberculatus TaxID=210409 RepID=A0A5B7DNV4_PORTR|nr:hypothetical protein [Portunus trituberculatus]
MIRRDRIIPSIVVNRVSLILRNPTHHLPRLGRHHHRRHAARRRDWAWCGRPADGRATEVLAPQITRVLHEPKFANMRSMVDAAELVRPGVAAEGGRHAGRRVSVTHGTHLSNDQRSRMCNAVVTAKDIPGTDSSRMTCFLSLPRDATSILSEAEVGVFQLQEGEG